jgi:hypothetical protein
MAAAQAHAGQIQEARTSAAEASRLAPTISARSFYSKQKLDLRTRVRGSK